MDQKQLFESIKQNLNGRPGQPIVLGVGQALATRLNQEAWVTRGAIIIFGVFFTIFTLVAYVLAGLLMPETEERTKGVFRGLGIQAREWIDRLAEVFTGSTQRNGSSG